MRELVFGPGDDVQHTLVKLQREVARYPADSAVLELVREQTERGDRGEERSTSDRVAIGVASFAGFVLHNRRIRGCTELMLRSY